MLSRATGVPYPVDSASSTTQGPAALFVQGDRATLCNHEESDNSMSEEATPRPTRRSPACAASTRPPTVWYRRASCLRKAVSSSYPEPSPASPPRTAQLVRATECRLEQPGAGPTLCAGPRQGFAQRGRCAPASALLSSLDCCGRHSHTHSKLMSLQRGLVDSPVLPGRAWVTLGTGIP